MVNIKEVKNTCGGNLAKGKEDFLRVMNLLLTVSLFKGKLGLILASASTSLVKGLSLIIEVILRRAFSTHLYPPVICMKYLSMYKHD